MRHIKDYRPLLLALLTLLGSMLAVCVAWAVSTSNLERMSRDRFAMRVDELQGIIQGRFTAYSQLLRGFQAAIQPGHHPSRDEWHRIHSLLQVERIYPGLTGIVYIRSVPGDQRAAMEQQVRRDEPNFAIKPAGDRPYYAVVTNVEPRRPEILPVIGADSWVHDLRRQTLEAARDSGETRITPKLNLVIDNQPTPAFLMYQPVYAGDHTPDSLEERRSQLMGFATAGCRVGILMQNLLPPDLTDISIRLYDGQDETGQGQYFASHPQDQNTEPPRYQTKRNLLVGGRFCPCY